MLVSIVILCAAGLMLFAATQASERRRRGKAKLDTAGVRWRRVLAGCLLAAALLIALAAYGVDFGPVYWVLVMSMVGLLIAAGQGILAHRSGWHRANRRRA